MIRYCIKNERTGLYLYTGVWCEEPEWMDRREATIALGRLCAASRIGTVIEEHEFSAADCGVDL